ncbi:MAG TPA: outer membrane lipoprotein carrier protein LolA [Psychromonas sp.]
MLINKKLSVLCCAFLFIFAASSQAQTLTDIEHKLTAHKLLRGQFIQTKTMQMFNQPLLSTGHFLLHHEHGLVWAQVEPFPVSLVLVKDKLSQQFAGQPAEVIQAKDNPMVFYFSHLFLSLFKGDVAALSEQFTIKVSENEQSWQLLLTPKSPPLNKIFASISILGDKFIEQLQLTELNGDISLIEFNQQQTQPVQLSDEELRAFQF